MQDVQSSPVTKINTCKRTDRTMQDGVQLFSAPPVGAAVRGRIHNLWTAYSVCLHPAFQSPCQGHCYGNQTLYVCMSQEWGDEEGSQKDLRFECSVPLYLKIL